MEFSDIPGKSAVFSAPAAVGETITLHADLGGTTASVTLQGPPSPASAIRIALAQRPEVYQDSPIVSVAVQALAADGTVPSATTIRVSLTTDIGTTSSSVCLTSSTEGICHTTIVVPSVWFEAFSDISVVAVDAAESLAQVSLTETVTLFAQQVVEISDDVALILPRRALAAGQFFSAKVIANIGVDLSAFTGLVTVSDGLTFLGFSADYTKWNQRDIIRTSRAAINAIRMDPRTVSAAPRSEDVPLFEVCLSSGPFACSSCIDSPSGQLSCFDRPER